MSEQRPGSGEAAADTDRKMEASHLDVQHNEKTFASNKESDDAVLEVDETVSSADQLLLKKVKSVIILAIH